MPESSSILQAFKDNLKGDQAECLLGCIIDLAVG
jgi:hypothetical protein